jgi:ABC-type multidrug transport system fused ATPase/permease subunit
MKNFLILRNLLKKKEKLGLLYVIFLMSINSILELLSISLLVPVITIILKQDFFFLEFDFSSYFNNFTHTQLIIISTLLLAGIYFLKNIFIFYNFFQQGLFVRNLQIRLLNDLFKKYIFNNYAFFLKNNTGFLLRNINSTRVVSLYLISYLSLWLEVLLISVLLIYLFYINFLITIVVVFLFAVFFKFLYNLTNRRLIYWGELKQSCDAEFNKHVIQSFSIIKDIKIFNKENKILDFFKKITFNLENLNFKTDLILQTPKILSEFLSVFSICILILISLSFKKDGIEIITLVVLYAAVGFRLVPSSTRITSALQRIHTYSYSLKLVNEEINNTHFNNSSNCLEFVKFNFTSVEFNKVSFYYNDPRYNILSDISFKINKGEIVGFVGSSGAGKSTLVNLISGILKPTQGKIIINQFELNDEKLNDWLSIVGYVPQTVSLFEDSIFNNIVFYEDINSENKNLFKESIKKSKINNFIDSLPDKELTIIGQQGSNLSGGQVQRIGIARALFKNPQFLIFDESTNSLDLQTEEDIIETIYSLKKDKTVLIISHKKDILKNCDKIFEIANGKLIQIK